MFRVRRGNERLDDGVTRALTPAALVKLRPRAGQCAVESNMVKLVCLPPPLKNLQPGVTCEIAGYGKQSHGEGGSPGSVVVSGGNAQVVVSTLSQYGNTCL